MGIPAVRSLRCDIGGGDYRKLPAGASRHSRGPRVRLARDSFPTETWHPRRRSQPDLRRQTDPLSGFPFFFESLAPAVSPAPPPTGPLVHWPDTPSHDSAPGVLLRRPGCGGSLRRSVHPGLDGSQKGRRRPFRGAPHAKHRPPNLKLSDLATRPRGAVVRAARGESHPACGRRRSRPRARAHTAAAVPLASRRRSVARRMTSASTGRRDPMISTKQSKR